MDRFKILILAFLVGLTSINCKEYFRVCHLQHYTLHPEDFDPKLCSHAVQEFHFVDKKTIEDEEDGKTEPGGSDDITPPEDGKGNSTDVDGGGGGGDGSEPSPDSEPPSPAASDVENLEEGEGNDTDGGGGAGPGPDQKPGNDSSGGGGGGIKFPYIIQVNDAFEKLAEYKKNDESLKLLFTSQDIYLDPFDKVVLKDVANQQFFASTVAKFLKKSNIDGMEVKFDYFVDNARTDEDRKAFTSFVEALQKEFKENDLILVASVPVVNYPPEVSEQVVKMSTDMEFLTIKAFGFHKDSMKRGHNAPLYSPRHDLTVNWTMNYWLNLGVESSKLVMGIQFHVRCYTLDKITYQINYGREKEVEDNKCPPTAKNEVISFRKICRIIGNPIAKRIWDSEEEVPYLVFEKVWITFENYRSLLIKGDYMTKNNFGGWALWDITLDDYTGSFCSSGKFPLLTALNLAIKDDFDFNKTMSEFTDIPAGKYDDDWPITLGDSEPMPNPPSEGPGGDDNVSPDDGGPTEAGRSPGQPEPPGGDIPVDPSKDGKASPATPAAPEEKDVAPGADSKEVSEASKIGSNLLIHLALAFFCFTF